MPFPATRHALAQAGYRFLTHKRCPCGASMELWQTPTGATIPMNLMNDDDAKAKSHFATCPLAVQFRRARKPSDVEVPARNPAGTPPQTPTERAPTNRPSNAKPHNNPEPHKRDR